MTFNRVGLILTSSWLTLIDVSHNQACWLVDFLIFKCSLSTCDYIVVSGYMGDGCSSKRLVSRMWNSPSIYM